MSDWTRVSRLDALAKDSPLAVELGDEHIMIARISDDEVVALEDLCTHDGGEISSGCIVDGAIECPRHGAKFCLKTGDVLAPPAYEGLHRFPVKLEEGMVWVRDDRWD